MLCNSILAQYAFCQTLFQKAVETLKHIFLNHTCCNNLRIILLGDLFLGGLLHSNTSACQCFIETFAYQCCGRSISQLAVYNYLTTSLNLFQLDHMASQTDASARFSGLINPIRDLALNWDVDIAHTLEDYLEELDQIRLPAHLLASASPGSSSALQNLNFAEAALLIQGSTCVYSKKVEHLHNLVFQALELISASKDGGQKVRGVCVCEL